MALCYFHLNLYEDSVECCNNALKIDKESKRALYRKAKCLALLLDFNQSVEIFKKLKYEKEISFVNELKS